MQTAQHNSLTPKFFSVHVCTPVKLPLTAFYGVITCYSEDQSIRGFPGVSGNSHPQVCCQVIDINADKNHASDGNE